MAQTQFHLLKSRRLLPLFVAQFLGAVNDNLFKSALVILIAYHDTTSSTATQIIVTLATALFILPYFLFSATAGQLADKYEKANLVRLVKLWEIGVMALAVVSLTVDSIAYQLAVLFLLGVQATFFGPVKYGILPDLLAAEELMGGNALVEAGTFLAILIGTIAGGLLILVPNGTTIVAVTLLVVAVGGWVASLFVPRAGRAAPQLRINPNIAAETWAIVRQARERREVWLSALGISWFWLVGAAFLSQFPNYAKDTLHADNQVVTLFLTLFSVGIGAGSVLCGRLLRGEISARLVPLAALGLTLFSLDLYHASGAAIGGTPAALIGAGAFLAHAANWRLVLDLFAIAACGGLYVVPLYAILQARSEESHRSRVIAANNILNALFMVVAGIASAMMLRAGLSVPGIFLAIALANAVVAAISTRLVPGMLMKALARLVFRAAYRVEVKGIENYRKLGERAVIVANHASFIDGPLLAAFLPGRPSFVIAPSIAERWWARPFLGFIEKVLIEPSKPFATKSLIRLVESGRHCVIFPEGRITVTGALMKVYDGPGVIADRAGAEVLPVRIDGTQYTPFSRLRDKVRRRWFPKVTITLEEPRRLDIPASLKGRQRRGRIGLALYDVMSALMYETAETEETLFEALIEARDRRGDRRIALEDIARKPVSYGRLLTACLVLARQIAPGTTAGERIGILLPNAIATVATFFALQYPGRVPAMLNYAAGAEAMSAAVKLAGIRTIITSRRFIEAGRLQGALDALGLMARIVYLEDIQASLGLGAKLRGLLAARFAHRHYRRQAPSPDDPAVVLFTSGSEGLPKGVLLSHRNILANCRQLAARIDFNPTDIAFNALPMFHAFGLTGCTVLPLVSGVHNFLYPSPLHYRIIPELVYGTNATILFGTDTFLAGYARRANAYDFRSLRYVFAGAERVRDETRQAWMEKFGLRIFEGYGATETSPVIATNTPMHFKPGTVGRLLPGISWRLQPVPGIEEGGRLVVAGANVMVGYLSRQTRGAIEPPLDGWYDTGDIVAFDDEGYLRILGRAKRFAKIGGEMVSLAAVEAEAQTLWPDFHHAALALPDPRKGEQVLLLTDNPTAVPEALWADARARGVPEIMLPRRVLTVPAVPLLATGKVDYPAAQRLAEERLAAAPPVNAEPRAS
jgi:acyl-[acyl-carrier-protein]-phospholipid O-acyltransferase/long-chain-fatty-acid--[acyl-carrier-protein] ligase